MYAGVDSVDWQRRLRNARQCADEGKEGDVWFLQASTNPLVSVHITAGTYIEGTTTYKRNVDLRFVSQHSEYPKDLKNMTEADNMGYNKFKEAVVARQHDTIVKPFKHISFDEYKSKFVSTCNDLDISIRDYHGIKCFLDGNENNNELRNCCVLHICDIMNIVNNVRLNMTTDLFLTSALLTSVDSVSISDYFMNKYLDESNRVFFEIHLDFFYMCYGYYSNHSFVPIRTRVNRSSSVFTSSSFFTNDSHFVDHQKGKLLEINQNESSMETRVLYRTF